MNVRIVLTVFFGLLVAACAPASAAMVLGQAGDSVPDMYVNQVPAGYAGPETQGVWLVWDDVFSAPGAGGSEVGFFLLQSAGGRFNGSPILPPGRLFQDNSPGFISTGFPNMAIEEPYYVGEIFADADEATLLADLTYSVTINGVDGAWYGDLIMGGPVEGTPPTFTNLPTGVIDLGNYGTDVYDLDATEPDGDQMTFSLTSGPAGVEIDAMTGVVTWPGVHTPDGLYDIGVMVSDKDGSDTGSISVWVPEPSTLAMLITASLLGLVMWRRRR
ncbi:MAG: PEP-CTERM sorting domain-containing protein [Pirellulales bacterium]|nr:PEP-CTERM sorting domain-containing protein [Pirellulales bacterium]